MSKSIPGLTTAFTAAIAIAARRLVIAGTTDKLVTLAVDGSKAPVGVTTDIPAAAGERVDVFRNGIVPVTYGGAVERGEPLTADAQGRAIAASDGDFVIGFAEVGGALGDLGSVDISKFVLA